jgi:molybdenum cofactor cytidylyltransferase
MKFGPVPIREAVGHVLAHNLIDSKGHKVLSKGRVLTEADYAKLRDMNMDTVIVAMLDATDLGENEAAGRVAQAVAGPGVKVAKPVVGRANIVSKHYGPVSTQESRWRLCVITRWSNRANW